MSKSYPYVWSIIGVALFFCLISLRSAKDYVESHYQIYKAQALIPKGKVLDLPSANVKHRVNLMLAVQEGCHFCEESVGFFRDLSGKCPEPYCHLIVVLPASQSAQPEYVGGLLREGNTVIHHDFNDFGLTATPTIVLLDAQYRVQQRWLGKLDTAHQQQLVEQLYKNTGFKQ